MVTSLLHATLFVLLPQLGFIQSADVWLQHWQPFLIVDPGRLRPYHHGAIGTPFFGPNLLRANTGLCVGKRLDSVGQYSPENFIPPSWCSSMGGSCCNLNPAWGFASNDPDLMSSKDGCHGCYDTTVQVQCSGKSLMSRRRMNNETEEEHSAGYVTAGECLESGGQCCSPYLADYFSDNGQVFDPGMSLKEDECTNCFDGSIQLNTNTNRMECGGNLLKSSEFKSIICSMLKGQCCDGVYGSFDPNDFPMMDCFTCYSEPLIEI